jgi:hypothetical protein
VATILLGHNQGNHVLQTLAASRHPLRGMGNMVGTVMVWEGIDVRLGEHRMTFWPLNQPARRHLHGFDGDYEVLCELLGWSLNRLVGSPPRALLPR